MLLGSGGKVVVVHATSCLHPTQVRISQSDVWTLYVQTLPWRERGRPGYRQVYILGNMKHWYRGRAKSGRHGCPPIVECKENKEGAIVGVLRVR